MMEMRRTERTIPKETSMPIPGREKLLPNKPRCSMGIGAEEKCDSEPKDMDPDDTLEIAGSDFSCDVRFAIALFKSLKSAVEKFLEDLFDDGFDLNAASLG